MLVFVVVVLVLFDQHCLYEQQQICGSGPFSDAVNFCHLSKLS